jgi:pyrroloquinoline quinone biosynthesis protein E
MDYTARVRISTGLQCQAKCVFCYYGEELNTQQYTVEQIGRMLRTAWDHGIRHLDFSGGEPTLYPKLPELIAEARAIGFQRLCMITNGIRTASADYTRRLVDAGLNEVLVSLHGHDAATHDRIVVIPGAHAKLLRSFEHFRALGVNIRINTVVTQDIVEHLAAFAPIAAWVEPKAYNFICFNDWVNAGPAAGRAAVSFSQAAPRLQEAIIALRPHVPKVTVRYIPLCFMAGFEEHVCNIRQNEHDDDEWNDAVKRLVTDLDTPRLTAWQDQLNAAWNDRRAELAPLMTTDELAAIAARGAAPFSDFPPALVRAADLIDKAMRRWRNHYGAACENCSRRAICDGLEPHYAQARGTDELRAIPGEPITDPMFFRGPYAAQWHLYEPAAC